MAQQAPHTNRSPAPESGTLSRRDTEKNHWTPETVLSTLPSRPQTDSSSPLPFFHILERLKTTKREGWRRFSINHGESISDHMYRMSIITMLCPPSLSSRIDLNRCTLMALVHDMAEALVGDITPVDGVAKSEKCRRETETMDYLTKSLLGKVQGGEAGQRIRNIWQEYEDNETLEAKFVHDVDKMELLLQMMEYERAIEAVDLGEFEYVAGRIELPEVKAWSEELLNERTALWKSRDVVPTGLLPHDYRKPWVEIDKRKQQDEYYGHAKGAENGSAN
ncbi:MAG: hypothetical protein M1820_010795 [Bogoriella megaspora]|nr:MAG: hypothetical protein M1820_010795 [Bogoriella megaspora]